MTDISMTTSLIFCLELKRGRYVEEIVDILPRTRVSAEVLETTKLQRRLSKYAWDDDLGDKVSTLLFRFFKIEKGEIDPVNEAVEKLFGWDKENVEKNQPKEVEKKKTAVLASSANKYKANRSLPFNSLKACARGLKQRAAGQKKALKSKEKQALQKKKEMDMARAYSNATQRAKAKLNRQLNWM